MWARLSGLQRNAGYSLGTRHNQTRAENIRQMASAYGVKLRPDLYECYNQQKLSELASLVKEENLAQELRVQG